MKKYILYTLKFSISVFFIFFIFTKINLPDFKKSLLHISWITMMWVIFIAILQIYLMGIRWYFIQRSWIHESSLRTALSYTWMGHFFSLFMPGGILAGDVLRGWYLSSAHITFKQISKMLLLEKAILLSGILFFCIPYFYVQFSHVFLPLGILFFLGGLYIFKRVFHFKSLSPIFLSTSLINLLSCINLYLFVQNFDPYISFLPLFILMPIITLVGTLPISFGGWGVREGAMIYFLKNLNIPDEVSLAISLALSSSAFIASLPGLITWIKIHRQKRKGI